MRKTPAIIIIVIVVALVVFGVLRFTGSKTSTTTNTTVNVNAALANQNTVNAVVPTTTNTNSVPINTNAAPTNLNATPANLNVPSSTNTPAAAMRLIPVTSEGFQPNTVTITLGDVVRWTNNTSSTVYVAPDNHPSHTKYAGIWDDNGAGQIAPGSSYTFTFPQKGTFTYHDHLDSSKTGTIVVQ